MSVRLRALSFGALVVGSIIAVDPAGLSPFGPAKWLVISTAAAATVALMLRSGTARCDRATWWMWTALLALLTLSALVNGDAKVALLGHPDRHLGMITWVLFFALFCAGQQLGDEATSLARAAVVAAACLGGYVLWEVAFGPPVTVAATTRRLLGPFGSAAFLGAACCLLGPVALGLAFDRSQSRRWRWIAAVSAVAVAVALVGSGTRAAWLGILITVIVVDVAVRPALRYIGWCAAGLVVALLVVAPRLGDVTTRHERSTSRLDEWSVATRVIWRHPLIGVGPEGYRIAFAEGVDDSYERSYRRDAVLPDRGHSAPLDVSLDGGLDRQGRRAADDDGEPSPAMVATDIATGAELGRFDGRTPGDDSAVLTYATDSSGGFRLLSPDGTVRVRFTAADIQGLSQQQASVATKTVLLHSTDGMNWSRDDVKPLVGFDSSGATRVQVTDSNVLISMVNINGRDAEGIVKTVVLVGTAKS